MLKTKPSARPNRRYLLIKGKKEEVEKAILDYIGILGFAKADPVFVSNPKAIVLSVNREELESVRAAFAMCENDIKVLRVSGTLKGLEK